MPRTAEPETTAQWKIQDAFELYGVRNWGKGYFNINRAGHLQLHPSKRPDRHVDLKELVDQLQARGIQLPILLRFTDILRHRVGELNDAFAAAIKERQYQGRYLGVYPLAANPQRHVVEEILDLGKASPLGLRAGSKPELLAALALTNGGRAGARGEDAGTQILCNGFKDEEHIQLAMLSRKIGKQVVVVVEKFAELDLILRHAEAAKVRPVIGVRVRLAARGAARRPKFGLALAEALEAIELLKRRGMEDCLQLVHFHLGAQAATIRAVKGGLTEAARIYAGMYKAGAGLRYLDVGEVVIDHYTLHEFANDAVARVKAVCDDAGVPHPALVCESGRAVAPHGMLVFDVLGVSDAGRPGAPPEVPHDAPRQVCDLAAVVRDLKRRNLAECYHDAVQAVDEALALFELGGMTVQMRALAERLFAALCGRVLELLRESDHMPEEFAGLEALLSDTYHCNFSALGSLPGRPVPIMPIHRLNEAPMRLGVLGDVTSDPCTIDRFVGQRGTRDALRLHALEEGEPYYLGAFLLGAHLGCAGGQFGDANAVHVSIDEDGEYTIDEWIEGDTAREVLARADYDGQKLADLLRKDVDRAARAGKISASESKKMAQFYEAGLNGYTFTSVS